MWPSIWQTNRMPHLKTQVSKTKLIFLPKLAACSHLLTPSMAPSFLNPHLKFQTYLVIYFIYIEYHLHAFRETVLFSYQDLLCNFPRIHSHLTSTRSHTLQHFQSYWTFFINSGTILPFFPKCCSFCLEQSPSAYYPHLHHQQLILIHHPIDLNLNALP